MAIAGAAFRGIQGMFRSGAGSATQTAVRAGGGALGVAGTAFSVYASHQMYSNQYGSGAAVGIGLAEAAMFMMPLPLSLAAAGAVYGLPALKQYGQDTYKKNREINMGEPIDDRFGTVATMRQRSASTLQRGRAVLGSEARMMHY